MYISVLIFRIIVGHLISPLLHGVMDSPGSDSASASSRIIYVQAHSVLTISHSQLFVSDFFFLLKVNRFGFFQTIFTHIWREIILKSLLPKMHIKKYLSLEEAESLVEDVVPPWSGLDTPSSPWDLLCYSERGCWTIQRWFKFHTIWGTYTKCQCSKWAFLILKEWKSVFSDFTWHFRAWNKIAILWLF